MKTLQSPKFNRVFFLDNIRAFVIFLVVVLHSGLVYESSGFAGSWWVVDDTATTDSAFILNFYIDIFIMSIIFFISGFFTPRSLQKKSIPEFILGKAKRLLIPWAAGALVLLPMYKFIFLYSRGLPQENWLTYFPWSNGIISLSWLWFLPVLFMFNVIYSVLPKFRLNIGIWTAVVLTVIIGTIYSYAMRLLGWEGWTKPFFINFQNERLLIYFIYFLLGGYISRTGFLGTEVKHKALYIIAGAASALPSFLYMRFFLSRIFNPAWFIISPRIHMIIYFGIFNLSIMGMLICLICIFKIFLNKEHRVWKFLSRNSYGVYIIHTVIVGGFAILLMNFSIPGWLKFIILFFSTYAVSNGLSEFFGKAVNYVSKNRF